MCTSRVRCNEALPRPRLAAGSPRSATVKSVAPQDLLGERAIEGIDARGHLRVADDLRGGTPARPAVLGLHQIELSDNIGMRRERAGKSHAGVTAQRPPEVVLRPRRIRARHDFQHAQVKMRARQERIPLHAPALPRHPRRLEKIFPAGVEPLRLHVVDRGLVQLVDPRRQHVVAHGIRRRRAGRVHDQREADHAPRPRPTARPNLTAHAAPLCPVAPSGAPPRPPCVRMPRPALSGSPR